VRHSLRKLVLSHNRLVNLQPLSSLAGPVLEHLDLNDNYVGELDQVKNLQCLTSLREVAFQTGNTGTNPMCDFENYEEAVRMYLPQLTKLDGKELIPGYKTTVTSQ
jgi:Leucine-rich repeat (LRR) protein